MYNYLLKLKTHLKLLQGLTTKCCKPLRSLKKRLSVRLEVKTYYKIQILAGQNKYVPNKSLVQRPKFQW